MSPSDAARALRVAREARTTLEPFTDDNPELGAAWGYDVQDVDRRSRLEAGERLVGAKLGLTSRPKQERMGVDVPIVGFLTDVMVVDGERVADALGRWRQPRIEPEVAFVTGAPIAGALTLDDVPGVVGSVLLAAEVIDSRWRDFRFRLADVVADNTSAAGVVLGDRRLAVSDVGQLADLPCRVEVDGEVVHESDPSAILGDPFRALQLLSRHLEERGEHLPAGSVVLAGAMTDAVELRTGSSYRITLGELSEIAFDL